MCQNSSWSPGTVSERILTDVMKAPSYFEICVWRGEVSLLFRGSLVLYNQGKMLRALEVAELVS